MYTSGLFDARKITFHGIEILTKKSYAKKSSDDHSQNHIANKRI